MKHVEVLGSAEKYLLAGDWHANFNFAKRVVNLANRENFKVILHLGDFGYFPTDEPTDIELKYFEDYLSKKDVYVFVTPGNHDDWEAINNLPLVAGMHRHSNHIWFLPRGFVWLTSTSETWMSMGGAYSVDLFHRTPFYTWWPQEVIGVKDYIAAHDSLISLHGIETPVDVILAT